MPTRTTESSSRSATTDPRISRRRDVERAPSSAIRITSPPRAGSTVLPICPTIVSASASERRWSIPASTMIRCQRNPRSVSVKSAMEIASASQASPDAESGSVGAG